MALRLEWAPGLDAPAGSAGWRLLWLLEASLVVAHSRTKITERGLLALPSRPVDVHRKVYAYRGFGALLGGAFRTTIAAPSRARRERNALVRLRALGEPLLAPEPIALAERRTLGFLRAAILATRTVAGARDLDAIPSAPGLAAAVGTAVARIHAASLADLDLAPRNLLALPDGGSWQILKVDSARLRAAGPDDPARAGDLADLLAGLEPRWPAADLALLRDSYAKSAGAIPPGLDAALPVARAALSRRLPRGRS